MTGPAGKTSQACAGSEDPGSWRDIHSSTGESLAQIAQIFSLSVDSLFPATATQAVVCKALVGEDILGGVPLFGVLSTVMSSRTISA